jgi:probable F420-dependent oxidoreductase
VKFVVATAFNDPSDYCALAAAADEAGWDAITVSDHVVHPERIGSRYPYTADGSIRWDASTPWPDPWVAIGAMAAVTERIRFLTNIFVLPLRSPFLAAKAIGTAAVLSGNRVAVGVGVGWMRDEFELMDQDFHTRGRRADEMIEVMRKLWSGEFVEHHGRFYDFERLRMLPAPSEPVPIYVGGLSPAALRRAARLGDGWVSDIHTTAELREIAAALRREREACGRGGEPFQLIAACSDAFDPDAIRRLEEIGVTHYATQPWLFGPGPRASAAEKRDALRRFADDVIAKVR